MNNYLKIFIIVILSLQIVFLFNKLDSNDKRDQTNGLDLSIEDKFMLIDTIVNFSLTERFDCIDTSEVFDVGYRSFFYPSYGESFSKAHFEYNSVFKANIVPFLHWKGLRILEIERLNSNVFGVYFDIALEHGVGYNGCVVYKKDSAITILGYIFGVKC